MRDLLFLAFITIPIIVVIEELIIIESVILG